MKVIDDNDWRTRYQHKHKIFIYNKIHTYWFEEVDNTLTVGRSENFMKKYIRNIKLNKILCLK